MMSRTLLPAALAAAALLCPAILSAKANAPTFTWTGTGGTSGASNPNNWTGTGTIQLDGTELLVFPNGRPSQVSLSGGGAYGLQIEGHYHLRGVENTFNLGAGGLTYSSAFPSHLIFESYLTLQLVADQLWDIGTDDRVEFLNSAYLAGTGRMTKTGAGLLDLSSGNNSWSGGLQFNEGTIVLRPNTDSSYYDDNSYSLGTGVVKIGPDTASRPTFEVLDWNNNGSGGYSGEEVTLGNDFELAGIFSSRNHTELHLEGDVLLTANTTFRLSGETTYVHGGITDGDGHAKLTLDSAAALVLTGTSDWSGGTDVTKGILVFAGDGNLPSTGKILVGANGYAGITSDNSVATFLGKLDSSSTGTIGFDSDGWPEHFNETATIDLSAFNATLRLGSASSAVLSSNVSITPYGTNYRFGGGGGWLQVDTALTAGRTVTLDSPAELPLTVRFTNPANAFAGVTVSDSGAVFATGALPAGATISLGAGAYLGTEDPAFSANATALNNTFARVGTNTAGIIGFDIDQFGESPATREVNLTGAGIDSLTGGGYLGTSSAIYSDGEVAGPGVRFTGTIAPNSDGVHRFAAFKGGALEIAGTLTGNAAIIGHPDALGAFGDRSRSEYSTVLLSGNNANKLAGGVTLHGGRLFVGQAANDESDHTHALGEGTLTIAPVTFSIEEADGNHTPAPQLGALGEDINIANPIVINAAELSLGGGDNFTLSGTISGAGRLYVGDDSDYGFTVTLSGNNTYSGGTYLANGATLIAASNTALGQGELGFGLSEYNEVIFKTSAPVIHGLNSTTFGSIALEGENTILTINQASDGVFSGDIYSYTDSENDQARLVKTGAGTLRLQGPQDSYYGFDANGFGGTNLAGDPDVSIVVEQGTLVIGSGFYLTDHSSSIWVKNNGTLAVDAGTHVYNPVVFDSGARLAGHGYYKNVSIGGGAVLSPGLAGSGQVGTLNFEHLELNAGGILEWHVGSAGNAGGRDLIKVESDNSQTLVINATASNRFTLKVISLNLAAGALGQLTVDPGHGLYAWTVFDYDFLQAAGGNFDPNAFTLDVSQFTTAAGTGEAAGTFGLVQNGNLIQLTFTPVPEPSTYALLALGLGFIVVTLRRRRAM